MRTFSGGRSMPLTAAIGCLMAALLALLVPMPAAAHEGHDHGPPPPALPKVAKPRIAMHSDAYELVAIANGTRLTLFLDRYASNAPVTDARVEVIAGAATIAAARQSDGTYGVTVTGIDKPGAHALVFNIAHPTGDDLLEGTLTIAAAETESGAAAGKNPHGEVPWNGPLASIAIGLGGLVAGWLIGRAGLMGAAGLVIALAAIVGSGAPGPARAHDGHTPSPVPSADNLSGDVPRRLPDGSVFLPKPSQRLVNIHTQIAVEGEAGRTASLVGRVISDPNRAGVVQSINGGRVSAPAGGFPRLGQAVRAGDVLATVTPALPLADQSTLAEKAREIEGQIMLNEQKLARLSRLSAGNVAKSQLDDIELEIANARRRLESLRATKVQPETLTAPIDGIVSSSRAIAGQVVQGQDVLFQIVDPKALWIEALSFDALDAGGVTSASAQLGNGRRMTLKFEGRGRALQQQASVLQFSITDPDASVAVGSPVTVLVSKAETIKGMLLPREALIRGTGGETMVWQHVDPERFVARQVRVEPFDGERVVITGGIAAKDRIVVHGAEMLAQVR